MSTLLKSKIKIQIWSKMWRHNETVPKTEKYLPHFVPESWSVFQQDWKTMIRVCNDEIDLESKGVAQDSGTRQGVWRKGIKLLLKWFGNRNFNKSLALHIVYWEWGLDIWLFVWKFSSLQTIRTIIIQEQLLQHSHDLYRSLCHFLVLFPYSQLRCVEEVGIPIANVFNCFEGFTIPYSQTHFSCFYIDTLALLVSSKRKFWSSFVPSIRCHKTSYSRTLIIWEVNNDFVFKIYFIQFP